ncbi:helix-turn-helix transcriptional regulator [Kitasatospora viridis]|uniref:DNA-binding NarL/FixJ family response regulator n=1 Tax=Kitasatospora viridis TaxID=281105 RepID=A0A561SFI4_9ACTN|nr:LuxR C-terminal-related transcriptional regulator [Kitasatospora viridis]TWF73577.1 DNA-binding NarL/FixJ family response regulator [Kitasatospora viridis]
MNQLNSDTIQMSGQGALLDHEVRLVYEWTVRSRRIEPPDPPRIARELGLTEERCRRAVDQLVALCLLIPCPGGEPGSLAPVGPGAAAARLTGQEEARLRLEEAELSRRQAELARLRAAVASLEPVYQSQGGGGDGLVQVLDDMHLVRSSLASVVGAAEEEVLAVQPGGGHPKAALMESLPRDLGMLERGVRLRSVYQHLTRFDPPTRSYAELIIGAGAQIRTRAEVPSQLVVVDRATAFVPARLASGGALMVREPSLVAYFVRLFEHEWNQAIPYDTAPTAARTVSREVEDTIAVLLAAGEKDDTIARRLGMSTRTCRRHIAELLQRLGAQSRFQAGALAERAGLTVPADATAEATAEAVTDATAEAVDGVAGVAGVAGVDVSVTL